MEKRKIVGMISGIVFFLLLSSFAYGAVLYINPVDLVDYDTKLRTKVWWLTVVQNGMSDYVVGEISADQIKDKDTGSTASRDLEIRMKVDQETCSYTIALGEPIYRWDWEKISLNFWKGECNIDTAKKKCADLGGTYVAQKGCNAWCFIRSKVGYFGDISTPSLIFKSTITIKAGTEKYSATVSRLDQTEVNFPNDIAYARWTGSLTSGDECPKAKEEDVGAVWLYKDYKWHFIDYSDYLTYKSKNDNIVSCINGVDSDSEAELCVNEVNSALDTALLPKQFKSKGGSLAEVYGTISSGKVIINLNKLIQYPTINMYVRANWLGVVMPAGMPKIISVYSSPFDPREGNGYITVKVQNVGKYEGSFAVTAQCDYPFSIKSTEYTPTLKPYDVATVNLVLTAPVSTEEQSGRCKVIVYDRAKTINRDEEFVDVKTKAIPKGCEDYGYKSFPPTCPSGYEPKMIKINGLVCYTGECIKTTVPVPPPEEECKWWDIGCHISKIIRGVKATLTFIGGIIVLGLIIFIVYEFYGRKRIIKVIEKVKK